MGRHALEKYHPRKESLLSNMVETVEYGAASFGFGFIQNKFRNANLKGVPVDVLAGVGLKAAALAMEAFGGSTASHLGAHVNVLGNAGIGAFFHTLGAGAGMKSAGVNRLLLPPRYNAQAAKKAIPGSEILGGISAAPRGDFLSSAELAAMAR